MSSATTSLFASVALAAIGATGFVYTLAHPGVVAEVASLLFDAGDLPRDTETADAATVPGTRETPNAGASIVSLPAGAYGHFEAEAEINGRPIDVMVDTGASLVALTYEDAERLGIYVKPTDFTHIAKTANGTTSVAPVTISRISIGDITVRDVHGVVSERGKSERTLLGMSFLGRLSRVEMRGGTLVLQE
jgi:aspartyl protease family protein